MKPNIELNKKAIILITGFGIAVVIFLVLIKPLLAKVNHVSDEVRVLDSELATGS